RPHTPRPDRHDSIRAESQTRQSAPSVADPGKTDSARSRFAHPAVAQRSAFAHPGVLAMTCDLPVGEMPPKPPPLCLTITAFPTAGCWNMRYFLTAGVASAKAMAKFCHKRTASGI